MGLLATIKREERKLEQQVAKLQHELGRVRTAANALARPAGRELKRIKKRVLSAAAKTKISKAAKKRWAKVRAQAKKIAAA